MEYQEQQTVPLMGNLHLQGGISILMLQLMDQMKRNGTL